MVKHRLGVSCPLHPREAGLYESRYNRKTHPENVFRGRDSYPCVRGMLVLTVAMVRLKANRIQRRSRES